MIRRFIIFSDSFRGFYGQILYLCLAQSFYTFAQSNQAPSPPPGNIKLLQGYVHIKKRGIDTSVGEISKPGGLTIQYDNGALAGRVAGYHCGRGECVWYKKQRVYGRDLWIGQTSKGTIFATFPEIYVNFYAQTRSPEDIADFLMMVMTYGNDEPVEEDQKSLINRSIAPDKMGRLFPVSKNEKWGYIDEHGTLVIPLKFENASFFNDGLAAVVVIDSLGARNIHGYIDKSGKMVIKAQYDQANDFSEGLAMVQKGYRSGFIDTTGKEVIPLQFVEAFDFSEGKAAVFFQPGDFDSESTWGYVNKKGEVVIPPNFYKAHSFHEGVARVVNGKFGEINFTGLINTKGDYLISPKFSSVGEFSEGLIPVEIGGVDKKIAERNFTHISGKWGYVDSTGKIVVQPKFDNADEFSEGLANVTVNKKYGYIDKTGAFVIQPQFQFSSSSYRCAYFSEDLACFELDGKIGFIDRVVIKPQFTFATKFRDGFAQVGVPNKDGWSYVYTIIDKTGRIIWNP